jgi:prepilin-type N-terminal cleavage/methylation domain-containing protein
MHKRREQRKQRPERPQGRLGFTLIELLVVISLITFLAAMAVLIGPAILKSEQSSRGAQLLQGNLFIAKQQALRNRAPYGIRLLPDGNGNFNALQFIQQPDNFTGGQVSVLPGDPTNPTSPNKVVQFRGVDLTGGLGTADRNIWPVLKGDYFQQPAATGTPHLIVQVNGPTDTPPNTIVTAFANNAVTDWTTDYRILRSPRPVRGEETIFLPEDVIIDSARSQIVPDAATGNYDILFAPAGTILGTAGNSGKIILWVRDQREQNPNSAEQTLITVYTRTGLIAAFPIDTGSSDPYSYTKDPRAAGGF